MKVGWTSSKLPIALRWACERFTSIVLLLCLFGCSPDARTKRAVEDLTSERYQQAEEQLARLGPTAIPHLIEALRDPFRCEASARVLGRIDDPRSVQPLAALLRSEKFVVSNHDSIGNFGAEKEVAKEYFRPEAKFAAANALVEMKSADARTKAEAYIVLRRWDDCSNLGAAAIIPLIQALERADAWERNTISQALSHVEGATVVDRLYEALTNHHDTVLTAVIRNPVFFSDPRAPRALVHLLERSNPIRELSNLVTTPWSARLNSGCEESLCRTAMGALMRLGNQAVPQLLAGLQSTNHASKAACAYVLGRIGDRAAIMPLSCLLTESDYTVREQAAIALGEIGDARAVPSLINALAFGFTDPVEEALAKLGADAFDPLLAAFNGQNLQVAKGAARVLGRLQNAQSIPHLLAVINSQTNAVEAGGLACTAASALKGIQTPQCAEALVAALNCRDWRLRQQIARVLATYTTNRSPSLVQTVINAFTNDNLRVEAKQELLFCINSKAALLEVKQIAQDPWLCLGASLRLGEYDELVAEIQASKAREKNLVDAMNLLGTPVIHELIHRGHPGAIPLLSAFLRERGTLSLALDYLNSGQGQLHETAWEWVRKNGYEDRIVKTSGNHQGPTWNSRQ